MIPQRDIARICNRLLKEQGGKRIPDATLELDYCLAWFLVGLSQSPLRNHLVLKGGTALRRCFFEHYRFSEDLDFTQTEPTLTLPGVLQGFGGIYQYVEQQSGIQFSLKGAPTSSHNVHTFELEYRGPLLQAGFGDS